jgi:hypothetical protein
MLVVLAPSWLRSVLRLVVLDTRLTGGGGASAQVATDAGYTRALVFRPVRSSLCWSCEPLASSPPSPTLSSPRLLFPALQEPVKESYDGAPAQGVYGWRASPSVRAYRAYKRGEAPPEPEACAAEALSAAAGRSELAQLGLQV